MLIRVLNYLWRFVSQVLAPLGDSLGEVLGFVGVPLVRSFNLRGVPVGRVVPACYIEGDVLHFHRAIQLVEVAFEIGVHGNDFLQLGHGLLPKPQQLFAEWMNRRESIAAVLLFRTMRQ